MTVKRTVNDSVSDLLKSRKEFIDPETDQESIESSEEVESPRSVVKFGRWAPKKVVYVHSQVLKIREEDSHLGEGIGECLSARDKICGYHHPLASPHRDFVIVVQADLACFASQRKDRTLSQ
ncbi:hypothetical protein Acr_05g0006770 [Actinidia rufa]|uniref:Uncharacterized protein n=1 Tax=Actinidia rufa TaxID=165716 RepID=A0A7J0EKP3_9ERIC|nr:hypothetical protein Acr_05g0006770 [Actinidia rufa]